MFNSKSCRKAESFSHSPSQGKEKHECFLVTGYRVRESLTQTTYKPNIGQDEAEGMEEASREDEEEGRG